MKFLNTHKNNIIKEFLLKFLFLLYYIFLALLNFIANEKQWLKIRI
jgi:hypothetical protein